MCGTLNQAYLQILQSVSLSLLLSVSSRTRSLQADERGTARCDWSATDVNRTGSPPVRTHVRTSRLRPSRFKRLVRSLPCPPSECRLGMTNLNQFPNCCASYSKLLLPAVAVPRIATFPDTPPVESAKLAIPLMSDCTLAFDWARMTGIAG